MNRTRSTEKPIAKLLKPPKGELSITDALRQFGVSRNAIFCGDRRFLQGVPSRECP